MEITEIPFNEMVGLQRSQQPEKGLLQFVDSPRYHNHLGTVHAAAQFALAEACSGEYLLSRFPEMVEGHVGVVRRARIKFREPARGRLYAQGNMTDKDVRKLKEDLAGRGRAFVVIQVDVTDAQDAVTMTVAFDWYIQAIDEAALAATEGEETV